MKSQTAIVSLTWQGVDKIFMENIDDIAEQVLDAYLNDGKELLDHFYYGDEDEEEEYDII